MKSENHEENKEEHPLRTRKRWSGTICAAWGCNNYRGKTGLSFFHFPREEERCAIWINNIRRADLIDRQASNMRNHRLCSEHFEDSQFMNAQQKKSLIWNAIPTLVSSDIPPGKVRPAKASVRRRKVPMRTKLVPIPTFKRDSSPSAPPAASTRAALSKEPVTTASSPAPSSRSMNKRIDPPTSTANCSVIAPGVYRVGGLGNDNTRKYHLFVAAANSPYFRSPADVTRIKRLQATNHNLRNKLYREKKRERKPITKKHIINALGTYLEGKTLEFVKTQLTRSEENKQGCRWSDEFKDFAASLYQTSPKCYKMMQKVFLLPCPTTLKRASKIEAIDGFLPGSDHEYSKVRHQRKKKPVVSEECQVQILTAEPPDLQCQVEILTAEPNPDLQKFIVQLPLEEIEMEIMN